MSEIEILHRRIARDRLRSLVEEGFGDMVRFVADIEREVIAVGLRRELLRWRDLLGALYVGIAHGEEHAVATRALLRFTPAASRQIPHVAGPGSAGRDSAGA